MDTIFKALADPARRTLLDGLRKKDGQSLQELQGLLDMSRFGVMKHLGVLEEAGLVITRKSGRFKYHYLNALPLQQAIDRWIEPLLVKPAARAVLDLKSQLEGDAPMSQPDFVIQTFIRTTRDALWDALTDADSKAIYSFVGTRVDQDGDTYNYYNAEGHNFLVCRDTKLDPKSRIESTFEPKWGPDLAASRSVFVIDEEGDHCRLTYEHYDLGPGMDGVEVGWARTLSGLKTLLETGEGQKFSPDAA